MRPTVRWRDRSRVRLSSTARPETRTASQLSAKRTIPGQARRPTVGTLDTHHGQTFTCSLSQVPRRRSRSARPPDENRERRVVLEAKTLPGDQGRCAAKLRRSGRVDCTRNRAPLPRELCSELGLSDGKKERLRTLSSADEGTDAERRSASPVT